MSKKRNDDIEEVETKKVKKTKKKKTKYEKQKVLFTVVGWIMALIMVVGTLMSFLVYFIR